jgi:hypothetical protein
MNRTLALTWGALTLAPILFFMYMVFFHTPPQLTGPEEARAYSMLMFRLGGTVVVGGWLLVASYIIYVFKSRHVPSGKKVLWAAVLFFGNMLAMPVFWFLYVWRPLQLPPDAA